MDVEYSLRAVSRGFILGHIPFFLSPQPGCQDALEQYRIPLHRVIHTGDMLPMRQRLHRLVKEKKNNSRNRSKKPQLSVVMGVRNRDDQLVYSLQTLVEQTLPRSSYEIILINYGGDDEEKTKNLVRNIDPKINYIYTHEKGIWCNARARNIGVRAAKSDLICFLNPDGLFDENLLEEILRIHRLHSRGVLIQGRRYDLTAEYTNRVLKGNFDSDLKHIFKTFQGKLHGDAAEGDCQSFPKQTFLDIGGYDEDYSGWGADDNDFADRIVEYGLPKVWIDHRQCQLLHLYHARSYKNIDRNRRIYNKRKGKIIRNEGREWGQLKEKLEVNDFKIKRNHYHQKVDMVITTFNRLAYVRRCLETFLETVDHPYRLIVYDDASFDGTQDYLLNLKQQNLIDLLILSSTNLGLTEGRNQALKICTSPYVCICDSDSYFLQPWLTNLVRSLDAFDNIGIISAFNQKRPSNVLLANRPQETTGDLTVEYRDRYGTSNWLIRRELLIENDYFQNPRNGKVGYVSTDFIQRMRSSWGDKYAVAYLKGPLRIINQDWVDDLKIDSQFYDQYRDWSDGSKEGRINIGFSEWLHQQNGNNVSLI
jgi:glycosyltransferase involved in cell wall biosynthesis